MRYVESIAASRVALDLRPDYAEAWNNIGAAYNKLGRYQEAVDASRSAALQTGLPIGPKQSPIRAEVEVVGQIASDSVLPDGLIALRQRNNFSEFFAIVIVLLSPMPLRCA